MIENNFGLNGYSHQHWENFLCISKKCRENREKKRNLRNEKKDLQNDERRADIERARAETGAITSLGRPAGSPPPRTLPPSQSQEEAPFPILDQGPLQTQQIPPFQTASPPPPEPPKDNTMLYVAIGGGVLVIGVITFFILKKKRAAA